MKTIRALAAITALSSASLPALAQQPVRQTTTLASPVSGSASAADADARRAAAARLLVASRFRERQVVLLKDALRAAASEMSEECLNRAASGQAMTSCEAIAAPNAAMKARLVAMESDMLDEVMAASQTIYARRFTVSEMDEITRFFRTPVGQRYGAIYPQILNDIQTRKRQIVRRYLSAAAAGKTKP